MASLLAQQNIGRVEEDVRTRVQTQRVRITEFFHDYDRLRSGFVTAGQFKRVLDTSGIELTDSQVGTILKNYDTKGDGRINYRLFTQNINKAFNPNLVSVNPWKQTNDPPGRSIDYFSFVNISAAMYHFTSKECGNPNTEFH